MQIISCVAKIVFVKFETTPQFLSPINFMSPHIYTHRLLECRYPSGKAKNKDIKRTLGTFALPSVLHPLSPSDGNSSRQLLHTFPLLLFRVLCVTHSSPHSTLLCFSPCMPLTFYFTRFSTQKKCRKIVEECRVSRKNSIGSEPIA